MPLTKQQEKEIYPLLDQVLELPSGKAIQYTCNPSRAIYLTRMIQGLRYDTALESIQMYEPDSPFYGKGVYANLYAEPCDRGLLLTVLSMPQQTNMWRIIQCVAFKKSIELDPPVSAIQQLLFRARKKYPELLKPLWLATGECPVINYGELDVECAIIDIDINPEGDIKPPNQEQEAKHRSTYD